MVDQAGGGVYWRVDPRLQHRCISGTPSPEACLIFHGCLLFHGDTYASVLLNREYPGGQTSRYICLGGAISSVYRFIAVSSETLVSLMLKGL